MHDLFGGRIGQAEEGKVGGIDDLRPLVHILAALSEMLNSSMSGRAARRSAMRRPVVPEEPSIQTFTLMRLPPPMRLSLIHIYCRK